MTTNKPAITLRVAPNLEALFRDEAYNRRLTLNSMLNLILAEHYNQPRPGRLYARRLTEDERLEAHRESARMSIRRARAAS
jgi:hypothetical protein